MLGSVLSLLALQLNDYNDSFGRREQRTGIVEPSPVPLRHVIGVEDIMVESDYPHADSTWPDTQSAEDDGRRP